VFRLTRLARAWEDELLRGLGAAQWGKGLRVFDSIRIKTRDKKTAVELTDDVLARYRPKLVHESDEWEIQLESETDDDLPDMIALLRARIREAGSLDILVNGESYRLDRSY
jgi:hypothetical protein